jgi:rhodanese-related sulfurtransferase
MIRIKQHSFLLICMVFSFFTACSQNVKSISGVVLISPQEFQQKLSTEKGIIIDVRTPSEYNKGHLKNARLLNLFDDTFEQEIDKLDKKETYFVYCAVGGRSSEAAEMMKKKGFKLVYNMDGGFNKWNSLKLPVEQ